LSKLILVVEDDFITKKLLHDMFEAYGCRVIEADKGMSAIAMAIKYRPDLITLDMLLPDINGIEVAKTIRLNPQTKDVPIIALTASAMAGQEQIALEAGCDLFISKPFDIDSLMKQISKYLHY